jgi:hypothetical protein
MRCARRPRFFAATPNRSYTNGFWRAHPPATRRVLLPHPTANRLVQSAFLIGFAMRKALSIFHEPHFGSHGRSQVLP